MEGANTLPKKGGLSETNGFKGLLCIQQFIYLFVLHCCPEVYKLSQQSSQMYADPEWRIVHKQIARHLKWNAMYLIFIIILF